MRLMTSSEFPKLYSKHISHFSNISIKGNCDRINGDLHKEKKSKARLTSRIMTQAQDRNVERARLR